MHGGSVVVAAVHLYLVCLVRELPVRRSSCELVPPPDLWG